MSEVLIVGIAIGIVIGVLLDRLVLKATIVPWLLSHGWR